jgi:hypothetical protein
MGSFTGDAPPNNLAKFGVNSDEHDNIVLKPEDMDFPKVVKKDGCKC